MRNYRIVGSIPLRTLKFREPATGECFWRIPGALNAKECRDRLALLRRTIREIELKEDDSMSNEVGYDDGMKEYDANEAKSMSESPVDVNEAEDDENSVKIVSTKKYFLESALGMMLSASIQGKISADRISSGLWETFRFEDFEGNNFHQDRIMGIISVLIQIKGYAVRTQVNSRAKMKNSLLNIRIISCC